MSNLALAEYVDSWQEARIASPDVKPAICKRDKPAPATIKRYLGKRALESLRAPHPECTSRRSLSAAESRRLALCLYSLT